MHRGNAPAQEKNEVLGIFLDPELCLLAPAAGAVGVLSKLCAFTQKYKVIEGETRKERKSSTWVMRHLINTGRRRDGAGRSVVARCSRETHFVHGLDRKEKKKVYSRKDQ